MADFRIRLIVCMLLSAGLLLTQGLLSKPAEARTFAERGAAARQLTDNAIEDMLEEGSLDLIQVESVKRELERLVTDIGLEGHVHLELNAAVEYAGMLVDQGHRLDPTGQVAGLGLLMAAVSQVADDFAGGFLSSEAEDKPVEGAQTVFDTGVRNWMPFAGVTRSVSEGAEFNGWDSDATIVLVSRREQIMLSIENSGYSAEWLLPVPYSRSVSFGIDRGNEEFILLSVHAPDASTHFLIDGGGTGKIFVHRR